MTIGAFTITDYPLLFEYAIAFGAGVISFLSPCVLPIVPGYLSFVTGLSIDELGAGTARARWRITWTTALFVAGFTAVFVILGLGANFAGGEIARNREALTRTGGVIMLLFAAYLVGSQLLQRPGLYREWRFHPELDRVGMAGIPLAGAAFGFGWTPCLGPVLASLLTVAALQTTALQGATLLGAYGIGMGAAFLAVGLLFSRATTALGWIRRHGRALTFVSAGFISFFGFLLVTDSLWRITAELIKMLDRIGLEWIVQLG